MKKKMLVELEYTQEELEDFAKEQNLSVEQVTDEAMCQSWLEYLQENFQGIISVTPA